LPEKWAYKAFFFQQIITFSEFRKQPDKNKYDEVFFDRTKIEEAKHS